MLSAHALLIAAVFVPYFAMMAILFLYITRTGREHRTGDPERSEDERDPGPAALPLAA